MTRLGWFATGFAVGALAMFVWSVARASDPSAPTYRQARKYGLQGVDDRR